LTFLRSCARAVDVALGAAGIVVVVVDDVLRLFRESLSPFSPVLGVIPPLDDEQLSPSGDAPLPARRDALI
jgi:hypothetical protein